MKKIRKLSEYHKSNKIFLHCIPVFSIMLAIMGLVSAIKSPQTTWKGSVILISIAVFGIIFYVIALAFTNWYIKKLEKEEALEEEKKKELEKEVSLKDERIRELEKTLEEAKKDD